MQELPMQQSEQAPRMMRQRPPPRNVQVRAINRITPHMIRITVAGDELTGLTTHGTAEHIKIFLPQSGQDTVVMPTMGPNGPEMPTGIERPISRTYTPRKWNPATNELDIDFLIHGEGPAVAWVSKAKVGDKVVISSPSGPYNLDIAADWHLIAGDDTALPAIGTILEALPSGVKAYVFIEVIDAVEEQKLESKAELHITWLHRGKRPTGHILENAIREARLRMPTARPATWVACEANVMRSIRRHLINDRGIDRASLYTRGYWKIGESDHPDHDTGEDA
ncbi:MAG: siderophore-interacting protein [Dehalococcoidia bacterium]|nr:siderophore-interacting protein [Dehalococcoidia bacterium]